MKRYPSKPKPMPTSTSFDIRPRHVVTIDLHGLSVAEARAKLKQVLEHCPKTVTEVEVIHGYHSGKPCKNWCEKISNTLGLLPVVSGCKTALPTTS